MASSKSAIQCEKNLWDWPRQLARPLTTKLKQQQPMPIQLTIQTSTIPKLAEMPLTNFINFKVTDRKINFAFFQIGKWENY
jgi:hypothetical protein